MTLEKKSTATQELGALSDVIISAADPHRRSRAKVLDAEISYVDVGGGSPIVLLHGVQIGKTSEGAGPRPKMSHIGLYAGSTVSRKEME